MSDRLDTADMPSPRREPEPRPDDLLTTVEAGAVLRLSPRTLERMRVEGCGPKYHKAGRGIRAKVLYRRSDLMAWIEELSFQSTSEYGQRK